MPTASAALLPVNTTLARVLAVLLAAAVAVAALAKLAPDQGTGRAREILTAGLRAAVQLAVVSVASGWVPPARPSGCPCSCF